MEVQLAPIEKGNYLTTSGLLVTLSVLAYGTSFFLPAFTTNDGDGQPALGYVAFLVGFFGLFMLQTAWLANPALWIGLILVGCRSWKAAAVCGVVASGFALAALMIYEPGAPRPPHACTSLSGIEKIRLTTILPGYWCWLASMALFAMACAVQMVSKRRQQTLPSPS